MYRYATKIELKYNCQALTLSRMGFSDDFITSCMYDSITLKFFKPILGLGYRGHSCDQI